MGNRELHALANKYGIADTMYYGGDVMANTLVTVSEAVELRLTVIVKSAIHQNFFGHMLGDNTDDMFEHYF